jgi:uroporphyrinogen-III synthase
MQEGPSEDLPLEGIRVAVPATRRATETAALIRRWGGDPLVGPLLEEVPVADEAPMRAATEGIIAAPAGWSVHLTGVGTRAWITRAEAWGLREPLLAVLRAARIVARGPKSRKALAEYELTPEWTPSGETSVEIGRWLAPQLTADDTVALQLYGEPLPALTEALAATGAEVFEVAPYRWSLPTDPAKRADSQGVVAAIAGAEVQAIVVTSAVQATNLFAVARELGMEPALRRALTDRIFTAAVGQVSRSGLEREGVPVDLVAEPARLGALIRALAEASGRIVAKSRG